MSQTTHGPSRGVWEWVLALLLFGKCLQMSRFLGFAPGLVQGPRGSCARLGSRGTPSPGLKKKPGRVFDLLATVPGSVAGDAAVNELQTAAELTRFRRPAATATTSCSLCYGTFRRAPPTLLLGSREGSRIRSPCRSCAQP